jgi:predicted transcriptional regulator
MGEVVTADDSWKKSCYNGFDYTINDNSTVYEAVQKFAAFDIGCLVTVDDKGALLTCLNCTCYDVWLSVVGRGDSIHSL